MTNTTFINTDTIVAFPKKLKEHYGDVPLKIVLYNALYQHCRFVEDVAEKFYITLLFLPSYFPIQILLNDFGNLPRKQFYMQNIIKQLLNSIRQ
jgi:transposase